MRKKRPVNPFLSPEIYIPDGEAHAMSDGRLYLYGSHDTEPDSYCGRDYFVASTPDFQEWTVEGPSFRCEDIPWKGTGGTNQKLDEATCFEDLPLVLQKMLPEECRQYPIDVLVQIIRQYSPHLSPEGVRLYAPDAIERDGKIYLYFCLSDDSEGVAVADHPGGPFRDCGRLPALGIDPAIFVDDDGRAYYYWGQFSASAAELSADMISYDPDSVVCGVLTEEEHQFHEGSSIRKRGDTYYYVFADTSRNSRPTCLGYATSKSPFGPFTYRGIIIDNALCDPESWNNHGCIQEYNGQWYVFYHRSSRNSRYSRRACCERISFDQNGLIPEVKMTSQGAGAAFTAGELIPAYTACEVHEGAYIDGDTLVLPPNGTAFYRYLRGKGEKGTLSLHGEGNVSVRVTADGKALGELLLQNGVGSEEYLFPDKEFELTLSNMGEETVELQTVQFA